MIESELFGHRKGAFTGALQDHSGWLEVCPPLGTVFLDEIGELDGSIQVKLLRVLETREFQRLGETTSRKFQGKVIAATNRDMAREMKAGRFREDLYYRLCSDLIVTPSLREQLADSPEELRNLVLFIAKRIAGPEEAEALAGEVELWIEGTLGETILGPVMCGSLSSASGTFSSGTSIVRPALRRPLHAAAWSRRSRQVSSPRTSS